MAEREIVPPRASVTPSREGASPNRADSGPARPYRPIPHSAIVVLAHGMPCGVGTLCPLGAGKRTIGTASRAVSGGSDLSFRALAAARPLVSVEHPDRLRARPGLPLGGVASAKPGPRDSLCRDRGGSGRVAGCPPALWAGSVPRAPRQAPSSSGTVLAPVCVLVASRLPCGALHARREAAHPPTAAGRMFNTLAVAAWRPRLGRRGQTPPTAGERRPGRSASPPSKSELEYRRQGSTPGKCSSPGMRRPREVGRQQAIALGTGVKPTEPRHAGMSCC